MCWYLIIDFKETMQISQMRIRYNLFITGHNKALGHLRNKKKMQYQQIYTEKINKNLMGMMYSNLHKGIVEVHEKK